MPKCILPHNDTGSMGKLAQQHRRWHDVRPSLLHRVGGYLKFHKDKYFLILKITVTFRFAHIRIAQE